MRTWLLGPFGLLLFFAVVTLPLIGEIGARREAIHLVEKRGSTVISGITERLAERRHSKEIYAQLLANDSRIIAATDERDAAELAQQLVPLQAQLGLGRLTVYDANAQQLLHLGLDQGGVDVRSNLTLALAGVTSSLTGSVDAGLAVLAVTPIKGPKGITGAIVVGNTLDGTTLQDVQYTRG